MAEDRIGLFRAGWEAAVQGKPASAAHGFDGRAGWEAARSCEGNGDCDRMGNEHISVTAMVASRPPLTIDERGDVWL